jgi:hypothetical protein
MKTPEPTPVPPQPKPPPSSRRVVLVGASVLALTLATVVTDLRRVRTGELLVQSGRNDLRLTITRDGRPVEGPTGKRSFTLAPGSYDIVLDGQPRGLRVVPARVTVVRNQRAVVRVEAVTATDLDRDAIRPPRDSPPSTP